MIIQNCIALCMWLLFTTTIYTAGAQNAIPEAKKPAMVTRVLAKQLGRYDSARATGVRHLPPISSSSSSRNYLAPISPSSLLTPALSPEAIEADAIEEARRITVEALKLNPKLFLEHDEHAGSSYEAQLHQAIPVISSAAAAVLSPTVSHAPTSPSLAVDAPAPPSPLPSPPTPTSQELPSQSHFRNAVAELAKGRVIVAPAPASPLVVTPTARAIAAPTMTAPPPAAKKAELKTDVHPTNPADEPKTEKTPCCGCLCA